MRGLELPEEEMPSRLSQSLLQASLLQGYVTRICEIYIDDELLFGTTDDEYTDNTRKVLTRLREGQVTANPEKT